MIKDDYDLSELKQIEVRGLTYNIMPRYLYHYTDKDYERFSLDMLNRLVSPGSVAIDIGAHYGIYSLLAAANATTVYAFEPVPENFEILKRNIDANKLTKRVKPINKAVSDKQESVEFNVTWASDSAGFYEHPNAEVIRKIKVETAVIDRELKGVKEVSFIKIDTEGHELHVLDGMRETLRNNPQAKLLIEFNPECLTNAGTSSRALIDKILGLGYDIFALHEDSRAMVKVEADTSDETILRGLTYLNFLCLPAGSWTSVVMASHSTEIGGAELVLLETVEALVRQTDSFVLPYVTLPGDGPLAERVKALPVAMETIHMRGWTDNPVGDTEVKALNSDALASFARLFETFKPQLAVTNTMTIPLCAITAKAFAVPHIWSIHEFGERDHGLHFDYGYDASLRYIDLLSDAVLTNSDAVRQHVVPRIRGDKTQSFDMFVQTPVVSRKLPASPFGKGAALKLVLVGRVMPSKGQLDAVQAVGALRKRGVQAELALVGQNGSKQYRSQIDAYIRDNDLTDHIHLLGFQPNPADYVSMADIALMCSPNEAFGRVSVEAMLLGKPVVAADGGASQEIVEANKTGLLYKPNDVDGLAAALESLQGSSIRKKLGDAGQKAATSRYHNDYYGQVYGLMRTVIVTAPAPELDTRLFRDLLAGQSASLENQRAELAKVNALYEEGMAVYSGEYNKVYAAYNETSDRLTRLEGRRVIRWADKARHIINLRNHK